MQAGAHEVDAGGDHSAQMLTMCQYPVDGGRCARADDEVVVRAAYGLRAQQLRKAICSHLIGLIISKGEIGGVLLWSNDVGVDRTKPHLDQLLHLFKHRVGGHIADEAGLWASYI